MNTFAQAIVADLRAFCSDLLEPGLAPASARAGARFAGSATFSVMLQRVDALAAAIPSLVASLDNEESQVLCEVVARHTPARAALPRRATAWQWTEGRAYPRFWERTSPLLEPDTAPLGYVQFVVNRLTDDFQTVRNRLRRHVDEARIARHGTSTFARADLDALGALDARLERADAQLARCSQSLQAVGGQFVATDRLPHPFPRSPGWTAFRRLADAVLRPSQFLPEMIGSLLQDDPAAADLPFLYQRWVGSRLVRELASTFGFQALGDPAAVLLLGGCIALRRAATVIQMWSEPRLSQLKHPSGLSAQGAEATPDFVLLTPGRGGPDAFVLDATMSHDPTLVERKTHYRERIVFRQFRAQAGVPGPRRPLCAWAAVPLAGATHNQLKRPDGSAGLLPMQPGAFAAGPLRAWLSDIVDHADAWQLLSSARGAAAPMDKSSDTAPA